MSAQLTPLHVEREQNGKMETVARGALLPSGRVVIEWRREAFPEGERTDEPTLSIYESVADAEEATGGKIVTRREVRTDGGQQEDAVDPAEAYARLAEQGERQTVAQEMIADQLELQNALLFELAIQHRREVRVLMGKDPDKPRDTSHAGSIETNAVNLREYVDLDAVRRVADE